MAHDNQGGTRSPVRGMTLGLRKASECTSPFFCVCRWSLPIFFSLFFQLIIMKTPQDILTTINNYVANITPPHEMWTMIAARDHGKSKVGNSPTTMKACQPIAKGDKAGLNTKQAPIESLFTVPDYFCNLFSEPLTLRADQLSFST